MSSSLWITTLHFCRVEKFLHFIREFFCLCIRELSDFLDGDDECRLEQCFFFVSKSHIGFV